MCYYDVNEKGGSVECVTGLEDNAEKWYDFFFFLGYEKDSIIDNKWQNLRTQTNQHLNWLY